MTRRAISLGYELADLERGIEGVRLLADQLREEALADGADCRTAVAALSTLLGIIAGRLRLLRGVVTGTVDPLRLITAHNDAPPNRLPSDDPDVRFAEWGPEDRIKHGEQETAAARFQVSPSRKPTKRRKKTP